ncbi:hypothetical protein DA2_1626 [Desulfovibrio sp. A2]|nr:hypothetical protein DA2_1626 [Desulfovibrio sp. A2]
MATRLARRKTRNFWHRVRTSHPRRKTGAEYKEERQFHG